MIYLKRPEEIEKMRASGRVVARALKAMSEAIVPGKTTMLELDAIAVKIIEESGGVPSFLGYKGYPAATCISLNEVVVHGIPSERVLMPGDIVGLDLGVCLDGWVGDSAWTFAVGEISPEAQRLLNVTQEALFQGIAKAKIGNHIGDISHAVQKYVESLGYGVVRDLVGHGIGRKMHEEPSVPNFGKPGTGPALKEGMTICIEPMVAQGTWRVKTLPDDWTMVTADGKLAAHFEHMIAITRSGPDILTLL
ncbi:MAG: Methionine aminopeptidase 1 [Fimbriimonadaceae bacterium]|nr:Methionine aminopeptidase 1 [Fimbriimonadaceae bacterium]